MATKFKTFTRRFFIVLNVIAIFFFLLSCLAPYLNPEKWWFISFFGLGFPLLLLTILLFLVGWLIVLKFRYVLFCVCALVLGIPSIGVFFSFHFPHQFNYNKEPHTIRLATWNVARFIEMKRNNNKGSQTRVKMMELIKNQNADIICMQEFFHSFDSTYYQNLDYVKNVLGYPYWFYSHDVDGDKHFTGNIIFSRFPIIDSGLIRYPRPTLPESLMHVDIKVGGDTIRVYTTHLQSLQFVKGDYDRIGRIEGAEDSLVANSRTILSKIRKGFSNRWIQANIINQVLGDSPYPVLFCGDLNDVPNSYTYFTVRGEMQDAFLEKGSGIGRSFTGLSPTLRIDYIFADHSYKIKQFTRLVKPYSDHYMLVSDLELKK